ncbi:hypothetical protein SRHO_G00081880 [Serrasalmus rhombeus]
MDLACGWRTGVCPSPCDQFAGHMGLDRHLFSLSLGTVDLGGLTLFYLAAVEAWQLFSFSRESCTVPSKWIFEEPLFFNSIFPTLSQVSGALRVSFLEAGISKLRHVRRGTAWITAGLLADMVGLRSVRLASQVLDHLRSDLSVAVLEYLNTVPVEDCQSEMVDFPELVVRVEREDWQDGQGKLLSLGNPALGNFSGLNKQSLYFACTKVLNFRSLRDLRETKWTEVVGADLSPKEFGSNSIFLKSI